MAENKSSFRVEEAIAKIEDGATKRQIETAKHLAGALEGETKSKFWLMEGITTSDIPTMLTPAINVSFLNQYNALPKVWPSFAREEIAPDTNPIQYGDFYYDQSKLPTTNDGKPFFPGGLPKVGELDQYPAISFGTSSLNVSIDKAGERFRLSFEALRKTGNFQMIPKFITAAALHASTQEDDEATLQLVVPGGVNTANWVGGNQLTANPVLGIAGLNAAIAASSLVMVNGNPVAATRWTVVVSPALAGTVALLKSQTQVVTQNGTGSGSTLTTTNPADVMAQFDFVIDWRIPVIAGGTTANNFWFVIPQNTARPIVANFFLEGERTPLISIKDSAHFAINGGAIAPVRGSFDEDDIQTRVRHFVKGATISTAGAVWSNGSGS